MAGGNVFHDSSDSEIDENHKEENVTEKLNTKDDTNAHDVEAIVEDPNGKKDKKVKPTKKHKCTLL